MPSRRALQVDKVCVRCGARTSADVVARCAACDGTLAPLEPLPVECGFCGASNRWHLGATCAKCRGPLPSVPGRDPGPPPGDAPRVLPRGCEMRVLYWQNSAVLLGMIFTIVFCWTVLFPILGIPLWITGYRGARSRLRLLKTGAMTRGQVKSITPLPSVDDDLPPFIRIAYEFETPAGAATGFVDSTDRANELRSAGDVLFLLYEPERPQVSAIWPPIGGLRRS